MQAKSYFQTHLHILCRDEVIQLTPPVEKCSRKALVSVWPWDPVHRLTKPYCGPAFLSRGLASLASLDGLPSLPACVSGPGPALCLLHCSSFTRILEPIFEPEPQPEVASWRKADLWPRLHQSLSSPRSAPEPCPLGTLPGKPRRPSHA